MSPKDEEMEVFSSASTGALQETDYIPVISDSGVKDAVSDLPKSILEYYTNIEKVLEREDFENNAERELLEEKLLEQIKSDGITKILYHWDCSRVVERMLVNCSSPTLLEVGSLILPHIVEVACHSFASHVLELFIMKLVREIYTNETGEVVELAEKVFRKLVLDVANLISDTHGSYTLRVALQVLVGARIEDDKKKRKRWDIGKNSFYETQDAHPALKKILHKFTKRLVKMDVGSLLWSNQGAPLLSVLLLLLHRTNNKSLPGLKSVVSSSFDKKVTEYKGFEQFGALPAVLLDSKASYVVQSYIKICSKEELEELYNEQYKDIVVPLSLHPVANYTVQTLLENISSRSLALDMCSKIVPVFEDLLAESITGVVISVTKCCYHHGLTSNFDIMKTILEAFHIPDDQSSLFFRCVMSMTTYEVLLEKIEYSKKPTQSGKPRRDRFEATLAGSLLLQGLFQLGLLGPLEEGLCALSEDHILYLATNPQSSHAVQAFLSAVTIPAAAKHKFIRAAAFLADKLVVNPCGSRIVEAMWLAADSPLKSAIAQTLIAKEQAIRENTYGSIVFKNCNLKAFKQGLNMWEESERKKKKNVESFEKIINKESAVESTGKSVNADGRSTVGDAIENVQPESVKPKKLKRKESCVITDKPKKPKKKKIEKASL
ncbi:hypothetical protein ACHWQZ_G005891 [Mnemiopsis leidyi]